MILNKKYNGSLNILEKKVNIELADTTITPRHITIRFIGSIKVKTLLPPSYKMLKTKNAIMIIAQPKGGKDVVGPLYDLFEYKGLGSFTRCTLNIRKGLNYIVNINTRSFQLWERLGNVKKNWVDIPSGTKVRGQTGTYGDILLKDWDSFDTKWEDLSFTGTDHKIKTIKRFIEYDKENKTFITKTDLRK